MLHCPFLQTVVTMYDHCRYQVFCVPLRQNEKVNKRELDNKCFHNYNLRTKFFDKFLGAWASYIDGTQDDAAKMILYYMAKRFPHCYILNFEMATDANEEQKMNNWEEHLEDETLPPKKMQKIFVIGPDYVNYDGTADIRWNTRYGELVKVRRWINRDSPCGVSDIHIASHIIYVIL
jgi:hypothetical protein